MSAIFGVFNFTGKPVEPSIIKRMEVHLTPWGPDGQGAWINQSIALGFNAMRITPEDSHEAQPLTSPSGRYKVVADMRLDVREEIHHALNLRVEKATTPDSYYFAAAFDNWGEETWTKISGGYTAAVWDLQAGMLYLVRDALGERPLFYTSERYFFAFSTAIKGLFAHPEISRELDERKIADLLLFNTHDKPRTVYSKISRLPPGHVLQITSNRQITLKRYYSLYDTVTSQPPIKLKQDEYISAMREKLEKAVKRRIRSSYAIGAHLSSGLDSSTVSCIAANQLAKSGRRLTSFTMSPYTEEDAYVPKGRYYDESPLAKLIVGNNGNIDYQQLSYEDIPLFSEWEKDYAFQQAPILGHYNHVWYSKLMEEASKHDIRILLAGFAGNLTFSYNGVISLPEILRCFWYKLIRCGTEAARPNAGRLLRELVTTTMPPHLLRILRILTRRANSAPGLDFTLINHGYARSTGALERAKQIGVLDFFNSTISHLLFFRALVIEGFCWLSEYWVNLQARYKVAVLDPTADKELAEFSLRIPDNIFYMDGIPRGLAKKVISDLLPAEVINNKKRGQQTANWPRRFELSLSTIKRLRDELYRLPLAAKLLDLNRLDRLIIEWNGVASASSNNFLNYVFAVGIGCGIGHFLLWRHSQEDSCGEQ